MMINQNSIRKLLTGIPFILGFAATAQIKTTDLQIRDPFIVPHAADSTYYLYANERPRIAVYKSRDLETWEKAGYAFEAPAGFWGTQDFWAPDVYAWKNKFYMLVTFSAPGKNAAPPSWKATIPQGLSAPRPMAPQHRIPICASTG